MAKSPPPPELVEAYRLLKAGQRQAAGQKLQAYMADHKDDPQAWWLMAHAVGKPDHVRRCLESVLKLDPTHEKARAKLAKLQPAPEPQPAAPPPPPRRGERLRLWG
jgi:predicted Zn-dependent protease